MYDDTRDAQFVRQIKVCFHFFVVSRERVRLPAISAEVPRAVPSARWVVVQFYTVQMINLAAAVHVAYHQVTCSVVWQVGGCRGVGVDMGVSMHPGRDRSLTDSLPPSVQMKH